MHRLTLLALACWLTLSAHARADVDWSGTYNAGVSRTTAEVSQWGEDCGPRPQSFTDSDKPKVKVDAQGGQLQLVFPDRTLRSDGCWSPNPAVRVRKATGTESGWRVECKTSAGDAKQERGVYTIAASVEDGHAYLELKEESSYDWQLKQSHCVAKVRVVQRMSRGGVVDEPPAAPAATVEAPAEGPCATPGPLSRIKLRPSDARIAPGERQCFTAHGLDARSCTVHLEPSELSWDLDKPAGATATMSGSCFKAAARAAEAEGRFTVSVSARGVRAQVNIAVASADLSDITARRSSGSDLDVSEDSEGLMSDLGIQAAVRGSSLAVKLAISALLLAFIVAVAWWTLSARQRKRKRRVRRDEGDFSHAPRHSGINSLKPDAGSWRSEEQLICPTCRRGVAPGIERCPHDGAVPIPYAEYARAARDAETRQRTCGTCGAQLAAGARFCGSCGAKVRS